MIAYAPEGYFSDLACSCPVGHLQKKVEGILCIAAFGCPLLIYFLKMLNCLVNYYS
jgi:hypothetical protein